MVAILYSKTKRPIHSFIHIRLRQVDNRNYTMIKSINIKSYKSNVSLTDYGEKYVKVE